jgi:type III pantothenate kinase
MNLLIDMGNSRLKWGLHKHNTITSGSPVLYSSSFKEQLLSIWGEIARPDCILISCVNESGGLEVLHQVILQLWPGINIRRVKSLAEGYGVKNAYKHPEKLGVDRWLAMLASCKFYPFSTCIVSCGTAVTIDFLDMEGQHLGGLIAPGLTLMKKSLAQGAENLEFFERQFPLGLADNTEAATYSGTLFSIVGLIEHVVFKNPGFQLILAGGDAEAIDKELPLDAIIQVDLVLHGLAVVANAAEY